MTEFEQVFGDLLNFRFKVYRTTNGVNEWGQTESQQTLVLNEIGYIEYANNSNNQDQPVTEILGDYTLFTKPNLNLKIGDILESNRKFQIMFNDDMLLNDHLEIYLIELKEK